MNRVNEPSSPRVERAQRLERAEPGPDGVGALVGPARPPAAGGPEQLAQALHLALALAGAEAGAVVVCRPDGGTQVVAAEGLGPAQLARVRQLGSALERDVTPPPTARADAPPGPTDEALVITAERALPAGVSRAAGEAKSEFLAMMSHELRTPLNAIVGYTGLLADEVVGPINDTQRAQLRRVQDRARYLLGLIEEILTLSRAELGPQRLQLERLDPAGPLHEVVAVLAPSARRKGLALEAVIEASLEPALLDAGKVRQVLAHLLTNAVKFTERGGVVASVRSAVENGRPAIVYAVSDTGIGIAPADLDRIFEPFWQAERAHARRAAGTGLGLNVTRRLADLLGGDVRVSSTPGQGSTFELVLPMVEEG
jgi:signal transduction histidine kinase